MNLFNFALQILTHRFQRRCTALNGKRPMPRDLDLLSFAALQLISEQRDQIGDRDFALTLLGRCGDSAGGGVFVRDLYGDAWRLDLLVWELAQSLVEDFTGLGEAGVFLAESLAHGNSVQRMFAMEIAWIVRRKVPREACLEALFLNVADNLVWVDESVALARALFETPEEFWSAAEKYSPPAVWADQYVDRLQRWKRGTGVEIWDREFLRMELEARQVLNREIFGPPIAE